MRSLARLAAALALGAAAALGARGAKPAKPLFRDLTFEAGKREAKKAGKYLVVNVVTDHCPPCDRMHATTFLDPAVVSALERSAVALELNGTKTPRPVRDLRVSTYPTTIFFSKDGVELDRVSGFVATKEFLAAFADAREGRTAVDRARKALSAAKSEPERVRARHDLANAYAGASRDAEALAEFVWLYDEGHKADPGFAEQRAVLVPIELAALGRWHRPAIEALRERRKAATDPSELKSLNRALSESDMEAERADRLPKKL